MKKVSGLFLLFLVFLLGAKGQLVKKDTVKAGMYIENLYDLNFSQESFKCDFWIWFNYRNDSIEVPKSMELLRNKSVTTELEEKYKYEGINWTSRKIKAEILHKWSIKNFPFDKQKLLLEIEIYDDDTTGLYLSLDTLSGVDKNAAPNEWRIKSSSYKIGVNDYNTNFGDPYSKNEKYYSIIFECEIKRNVTSLFIKLFVGVFIAFAIAISSLFISSNHTDPRFGLPVGALFASIANKYIVDSIIPQTTYLTLVDKIHFLTFFMILLVIIVSIVSQKKFYLNQQIISHKIDKISFWAILVTYFTIILIWIF